jgi:peroxiredoxin
MAQNYYEQLGIPMDADDTAIRAGCENITARFRADWLNDPGGTVGDSAMKRIREFEALRDVLLDPVQRTEYDRSLGVRLLPVTASGRTSAVSREVWMIVLGGFIGLVIVCIVWIISARLAMPTMPAAAETNRPAPNFALQTIDGKTLHLNDLRGKIVLVNFWGTWCVPCKAETPALEAAYKQLKDSGVEFVGVNLRNQEELGAAGDAAVKAFVATYGVTYPIVYDTDGEVARAYQISPIPVSYFIDAQGNIRYVYVGELKTSDVLELARRLHDTP